MMDILLLLFVSLLIGQVVSQNHVCLKAIYSENTLLLQCKIDRMVFGVEFVSPNGSLYGSCPAPVPPELTTREPKDCGNSITQYVDVNSTVLRLENPQHMLGVWTCRHGTLWSNDTVNITNSILQEETTNEAIFNDGLFISVAINIIGGVVFVLALCKSYQVPALFTRWNDLFHGIFIRKRHGANRDGERVPLLANLPSQMYCAKCQQTGCALCVDCVAFFCGACFKVHNDKFKDHNICTLERTFKTKGKFDAECSICEKKTSESYCTAHKNLLCTSCKCENQGSSSSECDRIKLVRPATNPADQKIMSADVEYIHEINMYLSRDKDVPSHTVTMRICGLCALPGNILVIADTNSRELLWFQNYEFKGKIRLLDEPKSLVHLFDTRFAISLPQVKTIRLYNFQGQNFTEIREIDLNEYGKPFSLAYKDDRFAVEIAEGDSGYIGIFDYDGLFRKRINIDNLAYFTGNTIRLTLDTRTEKVFVSALGMKKLSCLKFSGEKLWSIEMPSPRSVLFIPDFHVGNGKLLLASKRNDIVYKVNPDDGEREMILSDSNLRGPRYMTYDKDEKRLYVHGDYGKIHIYKYPHRSS